MPKKKLPLASVYTMRSDDGESGITLHGIFTTIDKAKEAIEKVRVDNEITGKKHKLKKKKPQDGDQHEFECGKWTFTIGRYTLDEAIDEVESVWERV